MTLSRSSLKIKVTGQSYNKCYRFTNLRLGLGLRSESEVEKASYGILVRKQS